jgi:hypothetical protein
MDNQWIGSQTGFFGDIPKETIHLNYDLMEGIGDPDELINDFNFNGDFAKFTDELYSNVLKSEEQSSTMGPLFNVIGNDLPPYSTQSSDSGNYSPNSASSEQITSSDSWRYITDSEESSNSHSVWIDGTTSNSDELMASGSVRKEQTFFPQQSVYSQQNEASSAAPSNFVTSSIQSTAYAPSPLQPTQPSQVYYIVQDVSTTVKTQSPILSTKQLNPVRLQPYPAIRPISVKSEPSTFVPCIRTNFSPDDVILFVRKFHFTLLLGFCKKEGRPKIKE